MRHCIADVVGYSDALLRAVAAAVARASDQVLRLFDVAVMRWLSGQRCIAMIYPSMDCTTRTWCLPRRRPIAQQECRHIAWSMLMDIISHELVHSDLTPCSVLISGEGFGEGAYSFGDFCDDTCVAFKYAEKGAQLWGSRARLHRRHQFLRGRFVPKRATCIEHVLHKPCLYI